MGNSTAPTGARKPAAVKGAAMLGIYEISEDTLKGSFDPEGKKRPTEFKTGSGSETLVVHKRVKENKEDGRRVEPKLGEPGVAADRRPTSRYRGSSHRGGSS